VLKVGKQLVEVSRRQALLAQTGEKLLDDRGADPERSLNDGVHVSDCRSVIFEPHSELAPEEAAPHPSDSAIRRSGTMIRLDDGLYCSAVKFEVENAPYGGLSELRKSVH
jgi:hypothetical protein